MRLLGQFTYTNQDGNWDVTIERNDICINKDGEIRIYDLKTIESANQLEEYLYLHCEDGDFYQVKFEEGNFLVIDLFDKDSEYIDSVGNFVFGEEIED